MRRPSPVSSPSPVRSDVDSDRERAIPVTLITGFLGSGKSTLLNHLLASAGMQHTAVLINEFGEVAIDHLIVRSLGDGAMLLASGCICCTVRGELVDGLKDLYIKQLTGVLPPFSRLAIETTGLADPLPIIACLMRDPLFKHAYRLDGIVTTVDAVLGEAALERHEEAVRQAAVADRLVITKTDIAATGAVSGLRQRLAALNPGATVIIAHHGQVAPAQLLGGGPFDMHARSPEVQRWLNDATFDDAPAPRIDHAHAESDDEHAGHDHAAMHRHDHRIASFCLTFDEPVPWDAFSAWYDDFAERHADRILRVKGILNVGEAQPRIIHCVQSLQHPPSPLAAWPDDDRRSRIVFITHDLPRAAVEPGLRDHLASAAVDDSRRAVDAGAAAAGRWLNDAEQSRLFAALAGQDDQSAADILRLMLLTGARCEVCRIARWDALDLGARRWVQPVATEWNSANRRSPRRVALATEAVMLLEAIRARRPGGDYVFAETGSGFPLARVEALWKRAALEAGIDAGALDRLRPVFAANVFRGLAPELVCRLLGLARA